MLGRRRAAARRSMKAAATKALDWVSLENLQPGHLKELARAIHGALVDPVVSAAYGCVPTWRIKDSEQTLLWTETIFLAKYISERSRKRESHVLLKNRAFTVLRL